MLTFDKFVQDNSQFVLDYPVRDVRNDCKYYMVIVEPRCHPNFSFVCRTMLRFTNNEWGLHVFHGNSNEHFVKANLTGINVKYTKLDVDNLSIQEYNELLTSIWFHEQITSDKFLIFQTDSCLLKHGISDYMQYDYIGAPWPHRRNRVGNGGFSLRNKSKCMEVCKKHDRKRLNEDVYFSTFLPTVNAVIPRYEIACAFSCEAVPTNVLPLAVHKYIHNIKVPNINEKFKMSFNSNE